MQKQILCCAAAAALLLLSGCGQTAAPASSAGSESSSAVSSVSDTITPEDGAAILEEQLGTVDSATGNTMSYGYEDTITQDGKDYYNYRVSWLVVDHMSYLTNYLVSTDGKEVREYLPDATAATDVESAAGALLADMAAGDFSAVSQWVDPARGVTFTPYGTVNFETDRTVTAEDLAAFGSDSTAAVWGTYDGSGEPIELTPAEYWSRFVWNTDYTHATTVTTDGVAQVGNTTENAAEAYPDCSFVEYHFAGLDPQYDGVDWCSLKLVFSQQDDGWKLVGIIHSEMTV